MGWGGGRAVKAGVSDAKVPRFKSRGGPKFQHSQKTIFEFQLPLEKIFRMSFVKNDFSKFRLKSFFGIQRSPKTIYSNVKNLMLPLAAYSLTDPEVGEPAK